METQEIWKDIKDYKGIYQISNLGNIRSLKTKIIVHGKQLIINRIKILKKKETNQGYESITLKREGKTYSYLIHRLVALNFIDNPNNKKCVNHKDLIKNNNHVLNLEWVTHKENTKHFFVKTNPDRSGKNNGRSKKIIDTSTKIVYDTIQEASKLYNYSQPYLSMMLSGKKKNKTILLYY